MDPEAERALHWRDVWTRRKPHEVSWYQDRPEISLDLIARCGIARHAPVIDVGGGASKSCRHPSSARTRRYHGTRHRH